jgi:hypothetical protein
MNFKTLFELFKPIADVSVEVYEPKKIKQTINYIKDTHVRHKSWLPWVQDESSRMLEQGGNKVKGWFYDGRVYMTFTNSLRLESEAYGDYYILGDSFVVIKGKAYGYPDYPEGRSLIGFGRIYKDLQLITLKIPTLDGRYVSVKSIYKPEEYYV